MEKMSLIERMQKHLREQGSLQVIELTNMLNEDGGCKKVTRNTVNTLLYTIKDRFKKVGYGRFNILDGNENSTEESIIKKLVILLDEHINYNSKFFENKFSKKELKIIGKIKKEELL